MSALLNAKYDCIFEPREANESNS